MKCKPFVAILLWILVLATTAIFASCTELSLSNEKEIVSIEIADLPDTIVIGTFDEIGGRLKVNYADGVSESVPFTSGMLSQKYQAMLGEVGSYTIEVIYRGKSATFEISVRDLYSYVLTIKNAQGLTVRTQTFEEGEEQAINYPTAEEMFVDGYRFTGFSTLELPITEDTTIYGEYVKTWKVSFYNAVNELISRQIVDDGENATAPDAQDYEVEGYDFIAWDNSYVSVHADTLVYGIYASVTASEPHEEPTATDLSYFKFTALGDDAYTVEPLNPNEMPEDIVIPSEYNGKPVTEITELAFYSNKNIKSIYMPDSIIEIHGSAFYGCSSLETVRLSESLTEIPDNAFYNCTSLTSCAIPEGVTKIGDNAFYSCKMKEVDFPSSLKEIGESAFCYVPIDNLYVPSTVDKVLKSAFSFVKNSVFLDAKEIEASYLYTASNITIGKNVKVLDNFVGNTIPNYCSILNILVEEENENYCSINGNLYTKDGTVLIQYAGGKTATSFIVPNSVKVISNSAFKCSGRLENIVLPLGIEDIMWAAFEDCRNLSTINLPISLMHIGQYAFKNCAKLIKNIKGVDYVDNWIISCSTNTISSIAIDDEIFGIADHAFYGCKNLIDVTIPDSIRHIGDYAFENCSNLTELKLGENLISIGEWAFEDCQSLTSIVIPDNVTDIKQGAFSYCGNISYTYMGERVECVEDFAFSQTYTSVIYYKGDISNWERINFANNYYYLQYASKYYYSETEPSESGNYWHYDDNGEIVVW